MILDVYLADFEAVCIEMLVLAFLLAEHINLVLSLLVLTGSLVHLELRSLQLVLESLHLHLHLYPLLVQLSHLTEQAVQNSNETK